MYAVNGAAMLDFGYRKFNGNRYSNIYIFIWGTSTHTYTLLTLIPCVCVCTIFEKTTGVNGGLREQMQYQRINLKVMSPFIRVCIIRVYAGIEVYVF